MDWKKKIAAVVFLLSLVCIPVAAFLLPDQAFSKTERRKLAKKPSFTVAAFWDGTYMEQLETYFSEQFPGEGRIAHSESGDGDGTFGKSGYQWLF